MVDLFPHLLHFLPNPLVFLLILDHEAVKLNLLIYFNFVLVLDNLLVLIVDTVQLEA